MQNPAGVEGQKLDRRMGLAGALSVNILSMVGIGPFLTIPLARAAMGGPQAMFGRILGAILCLRWHGCSLLSRRRFTSGSK
jgi:hypothetical protein